MDNEKLENTPLHEEENESITLVRPVDPVVAAFATLNEIPVIEEMQEEGEANHTPTETVLEPPLPPVLQKKPSPKNAVIPTVSWFGTLLIFTVPVLGLLVAILFACGICRRTNRIYFARAYLAMLGLLCFIFVISLLVLWICLGSKLSLALPLLASGQIEEAMTAIFS